MLRHRHEGKAQGHYIIISRDAMTKLASGALLRRESPRRSRFRARYAAAMPAAAPRSRARKRCRRLALYNIYRHSAATIPGCRQAVRQARPSFTRWSFPLIHYEIISGERRDRLRPGYTIIADYLHDARLRQSRRPTRILPHALLLTRALVGARHTRSYRSEHLLY